MAQQNDNKKVITLDAVHDCLRRHIEEEETVLQRGEKRMEAIERDLQPIQKMYWAICGSAIIGTALIGVLLFIYSNDRSEAKAMRDALYAQGVAIERLLVGQQHISQAQEKDSVALEKHIEQADKVMTETSKRLDRINVR